MHYVTEWIVFPAEILEEYDGNLYLPTGKLAYEMSIWRCHQSSLRIPVWKMNTRYNQSSPRIPVRKKANDPGILQDFQSVTNCLEPICAVPKRSRCTGAATLKQIALHAATMIIGQECIRPPIKTTILWDTQATQPVS